jgi:hypothetical protein
MDTKRQYHNAIRVRFIGTEWRKPKGEGAGEGEQDFSGQTDGINPKNSTRKEPDQSSCSKNMLQGVCVVKIIMEMLLPVVVAALRV